MERVKPYGGNSASRLANLIKSANPKLNRPDVSFEFGMPVAVQGWLNTTLFIRPIINSSLSKCSNVDPPPALFEEIKYRRLSLDVLKMLPECELLPVDDITLPFSIHEILPQINSALGLDLTPEEVVNHRYENAALTYKLEIVNDANLCWVRSHYMFETILGFGTNTRLLEDGSVRGNESGTPRIIEGQ